jgi:hypothetical protein
MPAHTASGMSIESHDSTANPRSKTTWWTPQLEGPVIAATVVRLALMALLIARNGVNSLSQADTASYLEPGRNLLLHGRFIADGVPDLVRTPGYPLVLALTSLAGLPAAAVANAILSVLSVILVWKLGKTVFDDDRIALGAAWIFVFEPVSLTYSSVLLSETLFLALLLLSMERLAVFLRERRLPVLVAAGLWLTAATFVRPVTYYLPVALALGLFVVLARVPGLRWKASIVLLISVLPWFAAWQIRNRIETGYGGFSSIREMNLYFFDAADVTARVEHRPYMEVRKEFGYTFFTDHSGQDYLFPPYLALHPEQAGWSQGQRLAFMHSQATGIIRAHSGVFLQACIEHFFKTVFDPGAGSFDALINPGDPRHIAGSLINEGVARGITTFANSHPWVAAEKAVFAVVMLGLYLLSVRGIFCGGMHNACLWLLLGTLLYFLAIAGIAGGQGADSRYRQPIMPAVCILAAAGARRAKVIAR